MNTFSDSSSEESDDLPLSTALKLKTLPNSKKGNDLDAKREKKNILNGKAANASGKKKRCRKNNKISESENEWSESDDDCLNLKRIKNEFDYKCYFDPKATIPVSFTFSFFFFFKRVI